MTKGTITIKRKNGIYDQLWYVNADGYPLQAILDQYNDYAYVLDEETGRWGTIPIETTH